FRQKEKERPRKDNFFSTSEDYEGSDEGGERKRGRGKICLSV
ncbi:5021_t:CDS:1, partial [Funneliformis geosporum]